MWKNPSSIKTPEAVLLKSILQFPDPKFGNEKVIFDPSDVPRLIQKPEIGLSQYSFTVTSVAGDVWLIFTVELPVNSPKQIGSVVWIFNIAWAFAVMFIKVNINKTEVRTKYFFIININYMWFTKIQKKKNKRFNN